MKKMAMWYRRKQETTQPNSVDFELYEETVNRVLSLNNKKTISVDVTDGSSVFVLFYNARELQVFAGFELSVGLAHSGFDKKCFNL